MKKRIEGLKKAITTESDTKKSVYLYYDLAYEYLSYDKKTALKYALIAKNLAKEINDDFGVKYYCVYDLLKETKVADKYDYLNRLFEAKEYYESINALKMVGFLINTIGVTYYGLANYEQAYKYYRQALEVFKGIDNAARCGGVYNNIGLLLHQLKRYNEELNYYIEAIALHNHEELGPIYYSLLSNLSLAYYKTNEIDKAKSIALKAYKLVQNEPNYYVKNELLSLLGLYAIESGDGEKGIEYLFESIKGLNPKIDFQLVCRNHYYMSLYYNKRSDNSNRIKYLNLAYQIASQYGVRDVIVDSLTNLYKAYKEVNDYKEAYSIYYKLYHYEIKFMKENTDLRTQSIIIDTKIELLKEKNQELHYISNHDDLTGIYNRRYVIKKFEEYKKLEDKDLYVLLIDADDFKTINDTLGHLEGDRVLKAIGNSMLNVIGDRGVVGRYGGDEFIGLIHQTSFDEIKVMVEEIERQIRAISFSDKDMRVTVSGGIIKVSKENSLDEVLAGADQLLYLAKSANKDAINYNMA